MKRCLVILFLLISPQAWGVESRIMAQRVSALGTAIGSPFYVYENSGGSDVPQSKPRVAYHDGKFLVVWNEWTTANADSGDLDVKGARITLGTTTVLDATPIDIASGNRTQAMPDVATDSSGWMVVYQAFSGSDIFPKLYAVRVSSGGIVDESAYIFGDANHGTGSDPRIAWDSVNSKHLVMFTTFGSATNQYSSLRWSTLSAVPDNAALGADGMSGMFMEDWYDPSMMPGGGWVFVAPYDADSNWGSKNYAAAVNVEVNGEFDPAGYLQDGTRSSIDGAAELLDENEYVALGTATATDANYVICVWTRYSQDGNILRDGSLYAARADGWNPVEARGGTGVAISSASGESITFPSLAGDGAGNLLLAYEKVTDGSVEIASKILTVDGSGITPGSEVIIRTDTTGGKRGQIDVVYGDNGSGTSEFLVVWAEGWWGAL